MRAQPAEAGFPVCAVGMIVETGYGLPALAAIARGEEARFRSARVNRAMRGMQRPHLIDKAWAVLVTPHEIRRPGDADVLFVALVAGIEAWRGFELLPRLEVVADEDRGTEYIVGDGGIIAAFIIACRCCDGPTLQGKITGPGFAVLIGCENCGTLLCADNERNGHITLPF